MIKKHTKKGAIDLTNGSFVISDALQNFGAKILTGKGSNEYSSSKRAKFYMDGKDGFVLGFKSNSRRENPLWLSIVSFSSGKNMDYYSQRPSVNEPHPVIVQLQGAAEWTYPENRRRFEQAQAILKSIQWEYGLVTLVADWARASGFPSLSMLPASMNHYKWSERVEGGTEFNDRLRKRYDYTAEQFGFEMQESGFYKLSLNYKIKGEE